LGDFDIFKKMDISETDKTLKSFTEFLKTLPRNRQIAILRSVYLKVEAGTAVAGDFLDAMSEEEKAYFTQAVIVIGRCTAD
jgi:hypothetical protein